METRSIEPKKGTRSGVEILVAEDSPTQAEQLKHVLEEHGYTVAVAADGKQALAAARRRKPTLIVSDIVMPEMDGYALCRAVKSDDALKDIPVVLLTTLSDARDVVYGLECGADNFIRKPYEGDYLLSRIDYLLMNLDLRRNQKMRMGIEISLGGQRHFITSERQQILDLLISTYEQAAHINKELKKREGELAHSNQVLSGLYRIAEGLNTAVGRQAVGETALERALEIPGVQAGWISLREGETGFLLLAARNLPPVLERPGAMEGECACRRKLLSGELDSVTNILECERLGKAKGDKRGLRFHASVPLWVGGKTLGVMNLAGPEEGLFAESELKMLYGIGHEVAVALERARLHESLEGLVEERTAKLTAEIAERKRIEEAQALLVAILEATPDMVGIADPGRRPVYVNASGRRMLGVGADEDLSATAVSDYYPAAERERISTEAIPAAIRDGVWTGESAFLARDGREVPISQALIAHKDASGNLQYLSTIARDITERKEQQVRIERLNRVYAVLSGINATIVRTRDRQKLFEEACRIAVEHGGFGIAWIGTLDPKTLDVTPVACAGTDIEDLMTSKSTARSDVPQGQGVIGPAMREKRPVFDNDMTVAAGVGGKRRKEALRRGYRSVIALPLTLGDAVVGNLSLFAKEPNFFNDDEVKLLTEVAGDISFALDHIGKEQRLDYLAYYDVLTGLPNRALFYDRTNQLLRAAKKQGGGRKAAVVLLDLDRFHTVNETFGRRTGDAVLKQVAERLAAGRLGPNHLARIGADTFAAVLGDLEKEEEAAHFVEKRVIGLLHEPIAVDGHELRLSARAGIALFPVDGADVDRLVHNAEAALKKAKLSGERYLFYTAEINARTAERLTLENKLRGALERRELTLHYQPVVDLGKGNISGLEALMRWHDPDLGPVPPARFIPVMEETGLILEAGRWALDQVVADFRRWQANGLHPPRVAVNVSQVQLRQKDFVAEVERALSGAAGAAGVLELEITESLIMQDVEANILKLQAVRDMGVEVAIDDFGTGFSSLSRIAKLPISVLKIDRAFIMNLTRNPGDVGIVTTIISLAHSLGLKVVAEGVETEEQAKLLRLLKCDELQGYLFSPAVPAERIEQFLRENKSLPG